MGADRDCLKVVVAAETASIVAAVATVIEIGAEVVRVPGALGGEGAEHPPQTACAAVTARWIGSVPARQQRGGTLAALLASVLVDRHVPTILP